MCQPQLFCGYQSIRLLPVLASVSICDRTGQASQLVRGHLTFTPLHMLA